MKWYGIGDVYGMAFNGETISLLCLVYWERAQKDIIQIMLGIPAHIE